MSIDLNNDIQDADVVNSNQQQITPANSEFYQLVNQEVEKENESILNYQTNASKNVERPYTFHEVQSLNAPSLKDLIIDNDEDKTAEEIIQEEYKKTSIDGREQSILVEAMRFGSQSALYQRGFKYQELLNKNKYELDRIFNFSPLLLAGGRVIPPIIVESDNLAMVEDDYTRRTVKKSYKIIEQAKVVSVPLNWREYLIYSLSQPTLPSKYSLPIRGNEREERIWANGVAQGWEAGLKQANNIMMQSIRKIERDYIGMIRFHIMLQKNMVSSPIQSNLNLGVTGDDETLNIGETVFEVIETPKFNKNAESWEALSQIDSPIIIKK